MSIQCPLQIVYYQWRTGPTGQPAHGRWAPAVSHLWGPSVSSN